MELLKNLTIQYERNQLIKIFALSIFDNPDFEYSFETQDRKSSIIIIKKSKGKLRYKSIKTHLYQDILNEFKSIISGKGVYKDCLKEIALSNDIKERSNEL